MARSQIIKDFVSEKVSLEIALKRLIVLLDSLGNEELVQWARCELSGYNKDYVLPSYRKLNGVLFGTFTVPGYGGYTRYPNVPLPTLAFSKEGLEKATSMRIEHSVSVLIDAEENGLVHHYPPEFYQFFEKDTNMCVEAAYLKCDKSQITMIIDNVKTRVLEILLKLEKEFGNLDDLDVDLSNTDEDKLSHIIQNLLIVIQDNSISIGDKNKIQDSKLTSNS